MLPRVNRLRLLAEFEKQKAILIVFPHENSDWNIYLIEAQKEFTYIINKIRKFQQVYLLCDNVNRVKYFFDDYENLEFIEIQTNDTWCRDFASIGVKFDNDIYNMDFNFNAWGEKFEFDLDNLVSKELEAKGYIANRVGDSFILEGGAIDSDGKGVLLTNHCLLQRHKKLSKTQIINKLKDVFSLVKVHFLESGSLIGDDTDAHIDTLARFVNEYTIVYSYCQKSDIHFKELDSMKKELEKLTDINGDKYTLIPMYIPKPIYYKGERLPATYTNFLITNYAVFVPTYEDENDIKALKIFKTLFPNRQIVDINCKFLIRQGGSLHCSTMQLY
ncbi:MAG: Agmatine deiminase (EC [uncultured Campylobacterales bacterium]|uniref:Agmatine deiminase (EC) n=1 Tax=uncultured Campylobacterales bacterium TaxID=352960 RepID=A0A6S6SE97_9BACT|nr:MAG: Agmatine deiminase (EC [uncultured Campylobacterales bacterium]